MGCYKLDKLDKIVISLIFIIVTLCCIFNTFCYASEDISENFVVLDGLVDNNGILTNTSSNAKGLYFNVDYKDNYLIINNRSSGTIYLAITENIPGINETILYKTSISSKSELTLEINENNYKYIYLYSFFGAGTSTSLTDYVSVLKTEKIGLVNVINQLIDNVGINDMWLTFEKSIPYIFVVVIFSLGVWFIKHNIIEHSKGRDF